jgi:hypothetical protein
MAQAQAQAQGTIQTRHIGSLEMNVIILKYLVIARTHHFCLPAQEAIVSIQIPGGCIPAK